MLGITVDAVRGRIRRGSLESVKAEDGTVYVLVEDSGQVGDSPQLAADQSGLVEGLWGQVDSLHDQVMFLRAELVTRNEELRRKDHIIAALTERIPELEPPREVSPEPRESPVSASEHRSDAPPREEDAPARGAAVLVA